jgi:Protein phosphatase 2C
MFHGHNATDTSHALSKILPFFIAAGMADLLDKYGREELEQSGGALYDSAEALSAFTLGSPSYEGQEDAAIPFTPDIVRPYPSSTAIDHAIKSAFVKYDEFIVWTKLEAFLHRVGAAGLLSNPPSVTDHTSSQDERDVSLSPRQLAAHTLSDATYGSSALVGLYESDTKLVKVALCGDDRALLGRPVSNNAYRPSTRSSQTQDTSARHGSNPTHTLPRESRLKRHYANLYETTVITSEQTPGNSAERERIAQEHPDIHRKLFMPAADGDGGQKEAYMGIDTTRGFGYAFLKWPLHIQRWMKHHCLGEELPSFFEDGQIPGPLSQQTGQATPYLTAEPEITTLTVVPGDFLVFGSKGLWECLSNEEVVGLVGAWLEERRQLLGEDTAGASFNPARDRPLPSIGRESSIRDPASLLGTFGAVSRDQLSGPSDGVYPISMNQRSPVVGGVARLVDPAELPVASDSLPKPGKVPWRWNQWNPALPGQKAPKRTFILHPQDLNTSVSVHVLRNALGGVDEDLMAGLLSKTDKKWRSDLAVQVVFFE